MHNVGSPADLIYISSAKIKAYTKRQFYRLRQLIIQNAKRFPDFWIVGPLPPVLISRYAKNHSPDDFCLLASVCRTAAAGPH